jgi:hypothetical protein
MRINNSSTSLFIVSLFNVSQSMMSFSLAGNKTLDEFGSSKSIRHHAYSERTGEPSQFSAKVLVLRNVSGDQITLVSPGGI